MKPFEMVNVESTDVTWVRLRLTNGSKQKLTPDKNGKIRYRFDKHKQRYVRVK